LKFASFLRLCQKIHKPIPSPTSFVRPVSESGAVIGQSSRRRQKKKRQQKTFFFPSLFSSFSLFSPTLVCFSPIPHNFYFDKMISSVLRVAAVS
jgi:hypothetical protein